VPTKNLCSSAPAPAHCAGLRQALLHDWQQGFPLRESPFRLVADRLGGTLREVLTHCHALSDEGSLDAIHVHWGARLQRVHWRCGLHLSAPPDAALQATLTGLPGVTGWDWVEPVDPTRRDDGPPDAPWPNLWFDLWARHTSAARAQRERIEASHGTLSCLVLDEGTGWPDTCDCHDLGGPCSDTVLARRCEAGLPLVAHPFRVLSEGLHRSEREVIATLRRWQRAGNVDGLGLGGGAPSSRTLWTLVAVMGPPVNVATRAALLARPGVGEVQALPQHPDWPFRLLAAGEGASVQTVGLLRRALAACGLASRPHIMLRVCRVRVRHAPLLFSGVAAFDPPDRAVATPIGCSPERLGRPQRDA